MTTALKKNDPAQAREFFAKKMAFTTGPVELNAQIESHADLVIVDVRASEDFEKGHIPGAISLPREQWDARGKEIRARGLQECGARVYA